jgi:hypothetical protein
MLKKLPKAGYKGKPFETPAFKATPIIMHRRVAGHKIRIRGKKGVFTSWIPGPIPRGGTPIVSGKLVVGYSVPVPVREQRYVKQAYTHDYALRLRNETSPDIRANIIHALGSFRVRRAIPLLIKTAETEPVAENRIQAIKSLGWLGARKAIPLLTKILNGTIKSGPDAYLAAKEAYYKITGKKYNE